MLQPSFLSLPSARLLRFVAVLLLATLALTVGPARLSAQTPTVTLTSTVASPVSVGTTVTWNAQASGGVAPYSYRFYLFNGSTWTIAQDWSAASSLVWVAQAAGTYTPQVWVRNSGTTSPYVYDGLAGAAPLTVSPLSVTLTSDTTFPVAAGKTITWTAAAVSGSLTKEFRFLLFDGSTWQVGRDWSSTPTWTWTPFAAGTYRVQVWARLTGSTNPAGYDAWATSDVLPVTAPPPPVITSIANEHPTDPTQALRPVSRRALVTGGVGVYTFKFLLYDGTQWTVLSDWGTSPLVSWSPKKAGTYVLQVWCRNWGSTALYDAWSSTTIEAAPTSGGLTTLLEIQPADPTAEGVPITVKALAGGGSGPYTYRFLWKWNNSPYAGPFVGQEWSAADTFTFTPPGPYYFDGSTNNRYSFEVWVRNAGSLEVYDTRATLSLSNASATHDVGPNAALEISSLATDRTSVPAGTPVTWTAKASHGKGPYEYQFFAYDGTQWTNISGWSASNTYTWIPPAALPSTVRAYVQVWVRNAGSVAVNDAVRTSEPLAVTAAVPLAVTAFSAAPASPYVIGASPTFTAQAIGGTGPYTYRFLVHDGASWTIAREWDAANSFTWTPAAAGTYNMQVWVRNAGSSATYDAWAGVGPIAVQPRPLAVNLLSATPGAVAGTALVTANADGGTGPYTYRFVYSLNNGPWFIGQDWGAANTWTWTPVTVSDARIQVWVRNAGSSADYDAFRELDVTIPFARLVFSPSAPAVVGSPITLTAFATGGTAPYTYRYRLLNLTLGGPPVVLLDWSTSNSVFWTPTTGGEYVLTVDLRDATGIVANVNPKVEISVPARY